MKMGNAVRLGDYFGARPIVLSLVYFNCPALCTEVLNGELHTMQASSLTLGKDYDAISVSFDPKDTPDVASAKRDVYTAQYRQFGRPGAAQYWHFLTGDAASINALTRAVGFHYAYDPAINQFAHAAAIMLLTPDGRDVPLFLRRDLFRARFPPRPGGRLQRKDRHAHRPGHAVLLPVRSGNRANTAWSL